MLSASPIASAGIIGAESTNVRPFETLGGYLVCVICKCYSFLSLHRKCTYFEDVRLLLQTDVTYFQFFVSNLINLSLHVVKGT